MKKLLIIAFSLFLGFTSYCQVKPYDENIDAVKQINQAIKQANKENKYVICQVGGNWCKWCLMFTDFAENTKSIKQAIDKDFILIHVNYSKANKNPEAMKLLENPARFGFPVFVILDSNGKRIHTQNSAYLEKGEGYDEQKVLDFIKQWTPSAVKTLK
jgi:thioredoxin-related protein